jgi:hypothetical protein
MAIIVPLLAVSARSGPAVPLRRIVASSPRGAIRGRSPTYFAQNEARRRVVGIHAQPFPRHLDKEGEV